MSTSALASLKEGYVLGVLSGYSSITEMVEAGCLPFGKSYSAQLLAADPFPHQHALHRRLDAAPQGRYLAVDLVSIAHAGPKIEGLGRHYSSSHKGVRWGHNLVSSALVSPGHDPYLLRSDPFLDARMRTKDYPGRSATEALLDVVGDLHTARYDIKGVLVDAQFTTRLALRSLMALPVGFIGRYRTNNRVLYEGTKTSVRELAEQHRPGVARWYCKLSRYVKRLRVTIPDVGDVDLLIIWKAQGFGWHLSVLVSTLEGGIQELMNIWGSRWSLEVSHRTRKQNLAFEGCQCQSFAAQLLHADLVIEAFNLICTERHHTPSLTWREAQRQAAWRLRAVLTGIHEDAA